MNRHQIQTVCTQFGCQVRPDPHVGKGVGSGTHTPAGMCVTRYQILQTTMNFSICCYKWIGLKTRFFLRGGGAEMLFYILHIAFFQTKLHKRSKYQKCLKCLNIWCSFGLQNYKTSCGNMTCIWLSFLIYKQVIMVVVFQSRFLQICQYGEAKKFF